MKTPIERKPDQTLAEYLIELSDYFCILRGCTFMPDSGKIDHSDDCYLETLYGVDSSMNFLGVFSDNEKIEEKDQNEQHVYFYFPVERDLTQDQLEADVKEWIEKPDEETHMELEAALVTIETEMKRRFEAGRLDLSSEELQDIDQTITRIKGKAN